MPCHRSVLKFGVSALLIFIASLAAPQGAFAGDDKQPAQPQVEVRIQRDIAYRDLYPGEDAKAGKNRLDLYLPKDKTGYPVIFFVHGGAWIHGDKNQFGIYSTFALYWAHRGVGTVVTNYRLSPGVKHPEHMKDVARAFAWVHSHITEYGGRSDQIFVCGHSAGGHLTSLLATDEQYLKAEGLKLQDIRGAIPISGVYRLHEMDAPAGFTIGSGDNKNALPTRTRRLGLLSGVFGSDESIRKTASPLTHVRPGLPPFLIVYADRDLMLLPQLAREFGKSLEANHCDVRVLEVKDRSHMTVLLKASRDNDPAGVAMREFIDSHVGK